MSSTNKTTNYELSQFVGSDKPAWLQDYNTDMSKIDTGIHNAATTATGADGKADANTTAIGTLTNLTTDDKTSLVAAVNEVDSHADTAQLTANTANTNASSANTKADNLTSQFNLSVLKLPSQLSYSCSAGAVAANAGNVTIISNQDQSLAKIYGVIGLENIGGTGDLTVTISGTGLALENTITIAAHGYFTSTIAALQAAGRYSILSVSIVLSNDTIKITIPRNSNINNGNIILSNSLLFLKDFGDVVIPN